MQEIYCLADSGIGKRGNNFSMAVVFREEGWVGFYAAAIADVAELLSLGGIPSLVISTVCA